jgi:hypothetical protein
MEMAIQTCCVTKTKVTGSGQRFSLVLASLPFFKAFVIMLPLNFITVRDNGVFFAVRFIIVIQFTERIQYLPHVSDFLN